MNLERRVKNLEIRACAAERTLLMLAFCTALEMESTCPLDNVGRLLGSKSTKIKDPADQELFVKYQQEVGKSFQGLSKGLVPLIQSIKKIRNSEEDKDFRRKVAKVINDLDIAFVPVITEEK